MTHEVDVGSLYRESFGRAVGVLARTFRDLDLAEEAVQDAFTTALSSWPRDGVPAAPVAWIIAVARNRGIDIVRRRARAGEREREAEEVRRMLEEPEVPVSEDAAIVDERLRLLFVCCHPVIPVEQQLALTLRLVAGLTVEEIARAFLTSEPTIAQRLVRAKKRLRESAVTLDTPYHDQLPDRLGAVLSCIYQLFTEGHSATSAQSGVRDDLALEAIRLARLVRALMPDEPEATGLLALLLLTHARRRARFDETGELIALEDHDRARYDGALAFEGTRLVRTTLNGPAGRYTIEAAISALHTAAPSFAATDWTAIVTLYDRLLTVAASPVNEVARAVAVSFADGPDAGLAALDELAGTGRLTDHSILHAARADVHRRAGSDRLAASAYRLAIVATRNPRERAFLTKRLASLLG